MENPTLHEVIRYLHGHWEPRRDSAEAKFFSKSLIVTRLLPSYTGHVDHHFPLYTINTFYTIISYSRVKTEQNSIKYQKTNLDLEFDFNFHENKIAT